MSATTLDRSDLQLQTRVLRQLEYTRDLDAHDLGVRAEDGFVTLSGSVETYPEKLAAEETVKRLYGVRAILNEIRVRGGSPSDEDLQAAVNEALRVRSGVPASVSAVVKDGVVMLGGTVTWLFQRFAAEVSIAYLPGVKGVENRILLASNGASPKLRDDIEMALMRVAGLDWKRICVAVDNGLVTLTGGVFSLMEKQEAERAAWSTPGVTSVKNMLEVVPRRWW